MWPTWECGCAEETNEGEAIGTPSQGGRRPSTKGAFGQQGTQAPRERLGTGPLAPWARDRGKSFEYPRTPGSRNSLLGALRVSISDRTWELVLLGKIRVRAGVPRAEPAAPRAAKRHVALRDCSAAV